MTRGGRRYAAGLSVRCETCERGDGTYELTIREADGTESIEVFDSSAALDNRLAQIEYDYRVAG